MYKTVVLETMEDVLKMAADQPFDERNGRHRGYYLYRGVPNAKFDLKTSLQRNCGHLANKLEPKILANFAKYTATEASVETDTVWKKMILGQHHSLPTRLLDWTHSPFIALHFSTDEALEKISQHDCVVWRIDIEELHEKLPEPFQEVMRTKEAAVFSADMLSEVAEGIEEYDAITEGKAMVIMEPPSIDPRIVQQYAFFSVVPGQVESIEDFLNEYTEETVKYIIKKELKWQIRDFLDEANISERTIYPGLDGICKWLGRHYYVKNQSSSKSNADETIL